MSVIFDEDTSYGLIDECLSEDLAAVDAATRHTLMATMPDDATATTEARHGAFRARVRTPAEDYAQRVREEWRALREEARRLTPESLPTGESVVGLWTQLKTESRRQGKSVIETSSMLALSAVRSAPQGARWLGETSRRVLLALLLLSALDFVRGAWAHADRVARVRAEEAAIAAVLADWRPGDALVAPWSWGVRASVRATGDPYALTWAVPGVPPRDPAWCGRTFDRIHTLPPGPAQPLPECSGSESGPVP